MEYVLAVDGGNSKTIALVAALDGTILGAGRSGRGDIYTAEAPGMSSEQAALANIERAALDALQQAGATPDDLVVGAFGMAGADWPEDYEVLQSGLQARGLGQKIVVQNDAMAVLHTGTTHNVGVSVVCGTGATTGARGPDGRTWYTSYWQWGVEGGAQLGWKATIAILRSEIGIEPPTKLRRHLLDLYQVDTVEEVLHLITGRPSRGKRMPHLGNLTPVLFDEADGGDVVARTVLQEHGRELGKYATAAAQQVGIDGTAFPLVLAGGVLRHPSNVMVDAIVEQVHITSPEVQPVRSPFEPVVGVLYTALETAGIATDEAHLTRIRATLPDAALFETRSVHLDMET